MRVGLAGCRRSCCNDAQDGCVPVGHCAGLRCRALISVATRLGLSAVVDGETRFWRPGVLSALSRWVVARRRRLVGSSMAQQSASSGPLPWPSMRLVIISVSCIVYCALTLQAINTLTNSTFIKFCRLRSTVEQLHLGSFFSNSVYTHLCSQ